MGLRPAHCYRETDKPSYTRVAVTVHDRNYIGASPALRTRQFNMGNPQGKYNSVVDLICGQAIQVRDNAIESMRTGVTRHLAKRVTKDGFFAKVRIYPYQILRENKQAQGAGADRVTKGMAHPFGKPIGRAARLREGTVVMSILVDKANITAAKLAMKRAFSRMPGKWTINVHDDVKSLGTLPKRTREEKVEVKEEAVTDATATTTTPAAGAKGKEAAPAADKKAESGKPAAKGKK